MNLPSWNLSRINATYQSYLHWVNLSLRTAGRRFSPFEGREATTGNASAVRRLVNLPSWNLSRIKANLSKLTLYHLKKRATRRSRRAREPSRIPLLFLRGLNKKNSMLKKFVFKKISTIDIPKSSKLDRYVNKVRKLYHARYKCNNKCDPKIINFNKMALLKKAFFVVFL